MKNFNVILLGIVIGLLAGSLNAAEYIEGEVIVKFKAGSPSSEGLNSDQPVVVNVDNTAQALVELNSRSDVEYAEPNYRITAEYTPNDWPHTATIWSNLDLPEAYDFLIATPPLNSVIVAVIDSGCDLDHPDLITRLVSSRNFINEDASAEDDSGHGTRVAGLIAAQGENSNTMAGLGWAADIQIMALKFMQLNDEGETTGSMYNATRAIRYAADHGARIINASWGIYSYSQALEDAVNYAREKGVLFVCSAGNKGQDNDNYVHYPSNLKADNLISVAALGSAGALASFSNYGHYGVDLCAPGSGLRSTTLGGAYTNTCSGTSFAAPCVSAIAALVLAHEPLLTPAELRQRLMSTSVFPAGSSQRLIEAGGVVNANNALQNAAAHDYDDKSAWTPPVSQSAGDSSGQTAAAGGGGGGGGTCFIAGAGSNPCLPLLLAALAGLGALARRRP